MSRDVVIVQSCRTPIGALGGSLASFSAPALGAVALKGALSRSSLDSSKVDEVIMGHVLTAGVGQAPARQASLKAGLPESVPCLTINKVCGSGLKAVMLAADLIRLGNGDIVLAGGMECMSQAPYVLPKARQGYRLGNGELVDVLVHDGLWDVYNNIHMGQITERSAKKYQITREAQDEYAIRSYERALAAQKEGLFKQEIEAVEWVSKKEKKLIEEDEEPAKVKFDKITQLRSVFEKDGTVTAANASSIDDGAAVCLLMSSDRANQEGIQAEAKVLAYESASQEPEWFTTAPVMAIQKCIKKSGLQLEDIDLFEINEAFAVVGLIAEKELKLDPAKVNVHGGAIALGHPIGASGARILTTLIHALKQRNAKYGLATLCIGGGEAVAMIVENVVS